MFSSPPKRRKTGDAPSLAPDPDRRSVDRASYQSPTRASLARSHPDVLQRALSRSPTKSPQRSTQNAPQDASETRPFGLRDRKALRPSLGVTGSPLDPFKKSQRSPARRASGIQAFAAPPRRVSRRIVPSDLMFQSPTTAAAKRAAPDASVSNTPEVQLASELDGATGQVDGAGDLDLTGDLDQGPSLHDNDDFGEPDLPPTPTQLGLEKPPDRPVGWGSSSPSVRTRFGKRQGDVQQSPSKLRSVEYGADDEGRSQTTEMTDRDLFLEPILKKRRLKKQLTAEVEQLKKDIVELERWSGSLDQEGDADQDFDKLISLLVAQDPLTTSTKSRAKSTPMSSLLSTLLPFSAKIPPTTPEEPLPNNTFALDQSLQTDAFLTVFGPLKLTAHSNTVTNAETNAVLERHDLVLSAPRPFPSKLYSINVVYETNPETQSVVSVRVPELASKVPEYLRRWITSRLANPLMNLDVSGLCWGVSRYWEAAIYRAQVWAQIEERHAALLGRPGSPRLSMIDENTGVLTRKELRRILPHLERSLMLFESREKELGLILSCELSIDEWASEPRLRPGITVSVPGSLNGATGKKIEQESKRLFYAILSENTSDLAGTADGVGADAIIRATDAVLGVLFGAGKKG